MHIHHPDMHIRYWEYVAYMPNLMDIFVSGTYFAITCEVEVAAGYGVAYKCKNVGFICQFSKFFMWAIFGKCQPYMLSDLGQIYVQCSLLNGWHQWLYMWHICVNTPLYMHVKYFTYMPNLMGIFVYGTYLAIICAVEIVVGCVLVYIY